MKHRSPCTHPRRVGFRAAVNALTFSGLAVGAAISLHPTTAFANLEDLWIGTTGDFSDPTQWSLTRVPVTPAPDGSGSDNADVFNGGTVMITTSGLTPNDVNAGGSINGVLGDGTYTQTGGSISIGTGGGWFRLGTTGGTTGTYNLQGGTLNFVGGEINVGEEPGSNGFLNYSGGTFNVTDPGGHFAVGGRADGDGGTGTLTISATGTLDNAKELWIGEGTTGVGTVNMSSGTLNEHNWLAIGRASSTGTLNFSGGTITKDSASNSGSHVTLAGLGTTQTATVNQTGGDFIVPAGGNAIWIGETATAIWNISSGTLQANDGIILGVNDPASNGTLNIQPPSNQDHAPAVVTTPTLTIGGDNFTTATVNLSGGTLATGGVTVGNGTGTRTLNFNGGTLQATAPNTDFVSSSISSVVQAGGAIIDTNGNDITLTTSLTNGGGTDGGLTKRGSGMLTLTGANSYTGPTVVSAGALVVNNFIGGGGVAGAVTVAQGATLSGSGTINLASNGVTINGILAPGALPLTGVIGTLTVATTGTFTLASTAVTQFDMNNTVGKDLIMASGAKLVLGGTLALTLPANFDYTATYTLFTGLASESGSFAAITGTNTTRTPTLTFTGGNLNLSFVTVPEPSTWAMGVFGLGLAAVWLRRRRVA